MRAGTKGSRLAVFLTGAALAFALVGASACGRTAPSQPNTLSETAQTQASRLPGGVPRTVTVTDDARATITMVVGAKRIVSLAPQDTAMVLALGLKGHLVGADPASLAEFGQVRRSVESVSVSRLNAAQVLALEPDLVLALPSNAVESERQDGLPLLVLGASTPASVYRDLETLGSVTGTDAAARQVVAAIKRAAAPDRLRTLTAIAVRIAARGAK